MGFFDYFTLTKPCDACGGINAGLNWCPACKISFCPICYMDLFIEQRKKNPDSIVLVCPMCGGFFESP